jgi:hypothetical protein
MLEGVRFRFGPFVHQAYGVSGSAALDVRGLLRSACDWANEDWRERVRKAPLHLRPRAPFYSLIQGRDDLRELLHAAVDKRPDLIKPSTGDLSAIRDELESTVRWRPLLERSADCPVLLQEAYANTHEGFSALFKVLLMQRQYRELVRRCPECPKVFLKEGKRRFCGPECATAANDAGLAERQKRRRARFGAAKLLAKISHASPQKRETAIMYASKQHPDATSAEQLAEHALRVLRTPMRRHK